jgi:DNA polymerase (family 10)
MQQKAEIKKVSLKTGLKIFQGIESDILIDGSLDYDKSILSKFDLIIASVHSRFHLAEDEMTKRIIKAIENPYTDVLGHPTGRLLLTRDPYKVNIKKIIDACSQNSVEIEINANPYRLDLEWRNIFYAREKGCLFSINPDAHSIEDINYIKYGINIARKAALQSKEVINCFSLDGFVKFMNRKVKRIK